MIDAYGLLLLQTFRALEAANGEVDFFGLRFIPVPKELRSRFRNTRRRAARDRCLKASALRGGRGAEQCAQTRFDSRARAQIRL
jgi:hypothetical protein